MTNQTKLKELKRKLRELNKAPATYGEGLEYKHRTLNKLQQEIRNLEILERK